MLKKNIFYLLSTFMVIILTFNILNVRAHSPITMDMEYDLDTHNLSVKITHGVSDPEYHYVYLIEIWVNITQMWDDHHGHTVFSNPDNLFEPKTPPGAPNYTYSFPEQESHNINNYDFTIIAGDRANITVTAHCSLGGSLIEHYYVGQPYYNPHGTFSLAVVPTIVSTIIVFGLLFILPTFGQKKR
jgi:hypothetical protein